MLGDKLSNIELAVSRCQNDIEDFIKRENGSPKKICGALETGLLWK
jgi:hypothetical protein